MGGSSGRGACASEGNPTSALELCWQNLHLIDQYEAAGISAAFDQMAMLCKSNTVQTMRSIANTLGGNLDNSERQRIISASESAVLQQKIAERTALEMSNGRSPPLATAGATAFPAFAEGMIVGMAPTLVVVLVVFGLLAMGVSWRSKRRDLSMLGAIENVAALAISLTTTVVLFGLARSRDYQSPSAILVFQRSASTDAGRFRFVDCLAIAPTAAIPVQHPRYAGA